MTTVPIWVRPGSTTDSLAWDRWRQRWVVACRAPAVEGRANRAVLELMARWLAVSPSALRWERAGASRAKQLAVDGLPGSEIEQRLRAQASVSAGEGGRVAQSSPDGK